MKQTLLTLATLAAVAIAAPTAENKKGFSIEQVEKGRKFKSGPIEMAKTYQKYNKKVPSHIAAAAAASQSGSVTATPEQYDSEYLCPVSVGTPAQVLTMDFDTGSSDFWVFSSELPSSESSGHTVYSPGKSSTSRLDSGETWDISYGDGSGASGNVYFDKVVIGGVTATSQAVECATSVSSEFVQDTQSDGLNGLAFDNINTGSPTTLQTWFGNVAPTLPSEIFTAYLKYHAPGSYDFGYLNSSKYTGSIAYSSVNTANGFWEFTASGYAVGSGSTVSSSLDCIADTGTTLIYLPNSVVKAYYSKVSGASNSQEYGGYVFPCSDTLPSLSIVSGGATHTVPGTYMNYAPNGDGTCYGGLQSSSGIGFNILGDVFLKSQYVVFDYGNTRIGFATQH